TVSATPSQPGDLEPVADFVRLTGPTDASLRAIGVDPSTMDLDELARALFGIGGYALQPGVDPVSLASEPTSSSFRATKAGKAVAVVVLPHAAGSHPEVSDKVFAEIAVAAGSGKDDQVMLVTDKFGPYSMYEREKRSSKTVFVTRERLQAFVDSFGIG
ncbi:MAG: hypothetical protein KDB69_05250, partial [Acidimicrobiia bacterium]|nr:hypothetical protein [Acidimicrobiia bacterium]